MTSLYRVRGLELAYHVWGEASAPAVILIHGFQDHGQSFARVARLLARDRYIIAPDLRGHGASGWVGAGGDYHFYDYVHDVLALIDHLDLRGFALVGHSMGGNVATFTGALAGDRVSKLVLLEGMGFREHDLADTVGRLHRWSAALRRPGIDVDPEARRRSRKPMGSLEEAADRLMRANVRLPLDLALELAASFTEAAEGGQGVVWRFDPLHKTPSAKPYLLDEARAIWRGLTMPVLSLYGVESPWVPTNLEARLACVRHARAARVEGAGHNIHHDQSVLLARALDVYLRDAEAELPSGIIASSPTQGAC